MTSNSQAALAIDVDTDARSPATVTALPVPAAITDQSEQKRGFTIEPHIHRENTFDILNPQGRKIATVTLDEMKAMLCRAFADNAPRAAEQVARSAAVFDPASKPELDVNCASPRTQSTLRTIVSETLRLSISPECKTFG